MYSVLSRITHSLEPMFFFRTEQCVVQRAVWESSTAASECLLCMALRSNGHPLVRECLFHLHLWFSPTANSWEQFGKYVAVSLIKIQLWNFLLLPTGRKGLLNAVWKSFLSSFKNGVLQMVLVGWMAPGVKWRWDQLLVCWQCHTCAAGWGRERGPLKHLFLVLHRMHHSSIEWGRVLPPLRRINSLG